MDCRAAQGRDLWTIERRHWGWLAGILLLAAALRFFRIGYQSLWTDEVRSIWAVIRMEEGLQHYFHGPLHAVLLQLWSLWGGYEDGWARALSAVIGLATLPLVYQLGRRVGGGRVGLLAAFLLAISPFHVWYCQEIRNYSLLIGLAALSQILLLRILDGGGPRAWLGLGLTSLGLVLSNFAGAFLIAAQGIYLLAYRRRLLPRFLLVQALVLLVLIPWLRNYESRWTPELVGREGAMRAVNFHPLAVPFTFSVFSVGFTVGPSLDEMNRSLSLGLLAPHLWFFIPSGLLFALLFARGLWRKRGEAEGVGFFVVWLLVPLLITSVLAILNIKAYNPRYAAVAYPALLLLYGLGLDSLGRIAKASLALLLIASFGISLGNHYVSPRYMKPDARSAAAHVEKHLESSDAVLVYTHDDPFRYYYRGSVPCERLPWNLPYKEGALRELLDRLAREHERVWLVDYRGWHMDPEGRIPAALDREWTEVSRVPFTNLDVSLYADPRGRQVR